MNLKHSVAQAKESLGSKNELAQAVGGTEIASTGKCKYEIVKYKVAKCVRVENTSTEN